MPLTRHTPHRIRTCGFPASGSFKTYPMFIKNKYLHKSLAQQQDTLLPPNDFHHLHRYYSAVRLPIAHHSFLSPCQNYHTHGRYGLSPVDCASLCSMTGSTTPQMCSISRRLRDIACCFPLLLECQPSNFTHFGAQAFALLPCCLRLADNGYPCRLKTRYRWCDFTLSGRVSTY